MTRSLTNELFTPFKDPKREFRSSRKLFKTLSLDESRSPELNLFSDLEENFEEEVVETMAETMEQYMSKTQADYGSGVARPKIDDKDHFELKGQFLKELRGNTFNSSDHEDVNEHIEKVLEIVDLFHVPNITQDQKMLRVFLMSLTGAASLWLRNKPSAIQAQLNNIEREIKKVNEKVYAAQVGCVQCKGPHYTKDCLLKEEEKKGSYGPRCLEAYSYGASHIDNSIPRKEKDPGSFTLPCHINYFCFDNALADLGASVSVMPLSTYLKLDFIILDMPEDVKVPLILGRPFLSTAHTKIDVFKIKITLRVGDEKIIFKSVKPASSLIKRVYMLSLRERMELDLEARLMGESLMLNRLLDPLYGDYIELNNLNLPLELRRYQVNDLMTYIEECEVVDKQMIEEVKARDDNKMVSKVFGYLVIITKANVPIFIGNFCVLTDFAVVKDMDPYLDEGMREVLVREPFCKVSWVETKRFDGIVTIHDKDIATCLVKVCKVWEEWEVDRYGNANLVVRRRKKVALKRRIRMGDLMRTTGIQGIGTWIHKKIVDPFIDILTRGAEPKQLAFSAALGLTLGMFPIVGVTVFLCALAIALLGNSINAPTVMLANFVATPIELSLMIVFLRFGEFLTGGDHFPLTTDAIKKVLTGKGSTEILLSIARALFGWLVMSPFILGILYIILLPCFTMLVRKFSTTVVSPRRDDSPSYTEVMLKNREPLSEDIMGLPKVILGATSQRDTESYNPKRYLHVGASTQRYTGATTQRDTGSYYLKI
nr:E3 ubiquitin-protein ligase [Tanacetum cinerariifolium]